MKRLNMMLTGRRPFSGRTAMAIISMIVRVQPESVADLRPDLPRQLADIVRRCHAKDPDDRYPTAREVRDALLDLQRSLEGDETSQLDRASLDWLDPDDNGGVQRDSGFWRRLRGWRRSTD